MDLGLSGKIAVVTGASKVIGLAVTTALTAEGAHVVAGSRSRGPELEKLEDAGLVSFVPVDLATPEGPIELITRAEALGGVDVLINNAGAVTPRPGASPASRTNSGTLPGTWV
jgi:NAD(P)-dependent dehydrogenase (short-subunit alcohol dehydrogenase family)